MGTFFEEGGWGMYPTLLFGLVLLAFAVSTVFRPTKFWPVTAVMAGITLCAGLLGACMGIINTMKAVQHVRLEDVAVIAGGGIGESTNNMVLSLVLVISAGLISALAALRASRSSRT